LISQGILTEISSGSLCSEQLKTHQPIGKLLVNLASSPRRRCATPCPKKLGLQSVDLTQIVVDSMG